MEQQEYSTEKAIRDQIISWGRGKIFFANDFTMFCTPENVRQALCVLTSEHFIERLARGIYCFPRLVGEYSIQTLYPDTETIAQAVADRSKIRIIPYGDQAAYLVGFTTLQMGRYTYLTDGAPRTIKANYTTIIFHHTSEMRIFSFRNRTMQLLSLAIRAVGKEGYTPQMAAIAAEHITNVPREDFEHDVKLCPGWVSELFFDL